MTFQVTNDPSGFVRVLDTGMVRIYFLSPQAYKALDQISPGAQARLAAAAEFSLDGRGEIMKSSVKMEQLITAYLSYRNGSVGKPTVPANVLAAIAALNTAVAQV